MEVLWGAEHPKPTLCGRSQMPNPAGRAESQSASSAQRLHSSSAGPAGCSSDKGSRAGPGPSQGQEEARSARPTHQAPQPPGTRDPGPGAGPGLPRPTPAARQPAPRLHGNGRTPGPGRGDEEPQRLSHSPHRHCGSLPCPVDVRAQGAGQRRRVRGTGWPKMTEKPPWRSRDCGSGARLRCAQAHPGLAPPHSRASGFLRRLNYACAEAFQSVS